MIIYITGRMAYELRQMWYKQDYYMPLPKMLPKGIYGKNIISMYS